VKWTPSPVSVHFPGNSDVTDQPVPAENGAAATPPSKGHSVAFWVMVSVVILLSIGFCVRVGFALAERLAPPEEVVIPPAKVEVIDLQPRPFEHTVPIAGTLEPVHSVDVFPKLGGKVIGLHVQLGDAVRSGDPLATVESVEYGMQVRQAEVGYEMAVEAVELAERSLARLERVREASGSMGVSEQAYEEARIQVEGARTQRDVAASQRDLARQMVRNATMVAPVDGRISRINARLGGMVGDSYPAFHVADTSEFVVRVEVGDVELPRLDPGQPVRLWADVMPERQIDGEVVAVSASLDAWTRRAPVEIAVPEPEQGLVGNLFARGEIVVKEDPAALVLPAEVVERTGNGGGLVLVASKGRVVRVKVHVDAANRDELALSGLEPGMQVIVPGAERLAEGEQVDVVAVRGSDAAE